MLGELDGASVRRFVVNTGVAVNYGEPLPPPLGTGDLLVWHNANAILTTDRDVVKSFALQHRHWVAVAG